MFFLFFSLTLPFINVLFRNSSKFFKNNYRISISFIPSYFCHKFHICKFTLLMLYCIFYIHIFFFFFKRRWEIKEIHEGKQFNFLKEKNVNKIFSQHPTHHFHWMTLRKKKRETILIISHGKQFLLNVLSLLLSLLLSFVERNTYFLTFLYSTQTFTAFPPSNKLFF